MATAFEDVIVPGQGIQETLNCLRVGFEAHRTCKVAWADRWAFINEHILTAWPYHNVNAYCVEGTAKPFPDGKHSDGGDGLLSFEYALVTLFYTTNIFKISDRVFGWERLRGASDSQPLRIREETLFWGEPGGDPVESGESPCFMDFPGMTYERGYMGVNAIPATALTLLRCVNNAPLACQSLGVVFPAETLRYVDFFADRQIDTSGSDNWKLVYYHHFKPNIDSSGVARGWNWFWRPEVADFQPVYNDSGIQYKPCRPANLSLLYPA